MSKDPPPYSPPGWGHDGPPPGHFQTPYHPPPPAGFAPPHQPPPHQPVVVTQVVNMPLGPTPSQVTCPSCHASVVTRMETEASTRTHVFALLCCLLGLWPCVCVPYCMDSCQNQNHYCPNCSAYLGTYAN